MYIEDDYNNFSFISIWLIDQVLKYIKKTKNKLASIRIEKNLKKK